MLEIGRGVFLGSALNAQIISRLEALHVSHHVLVTDSHVAALPIYTRLAADYRAHFHTDLPTFVLPPGEESKSRAWKERVEDFLFERGCTRDTCLLALGGGVVGDLTGFVAATYMRGIPVIQLPTTLLAMVDSSVGGKTAVDTRHGKNLVGAFWQPAAVYIDVGALATLPARQFSNGLAEVIKMAAVFDEPFFAYLERSVDAIGQRDEESLKFIIEKSAGKKARVVELDERESGLRGLLNFGHTIGHAIEADLAPQLLHGEAISVGMVKEAEAARFLGHLSQSAVARLVRCLKAYGLPVTVQCPAVKEAVQSKHCSNKNCLRTARLMELMSVDKKNQGARKRMVLLAGIGRTVEERASFVDDSVLQFVLAPAVRIIPPATRQLWPNAVRIQVPGSKSISNRALLLAALGTGTCRLTGLLHSDDTQVMLTALAQLGGLRYTWEDDGQALLLTGTGGKLTAVADEIYLGNAGTAARFITSVCALAAPKGDHTKATVITGNSRMKERPIGALVEALRSNGVQIECLGTDGCLPLRIAAGGLAGGEINLSAAVSSQYVSSILLAAPYAQQPIRLRLDGSVSQPYIDMTVSMMQTFGAKVHLEAPGVYYVARGGYTNPATYQVEPDASSATYPLAIGALTGTAVTVEGLLNADGKSLQGDAQFASDVLQRMGASVVTGNGSVTVTGADETVCGAGAIDMEPMTDAFLTASVVAAVATGDTTISGIANQRVKECNRIAAMVTELGKFGVAATETSDGLRIIGRNRETLTAPPHGVHCYDDHRVAMSFSVLACVTPSPVVIMEKKCVEKTWPSWWDDLARNFKVRLEGVDIDELEEEPKENKSDSDKSIVIVGMRGAGKTTMGRRLAQIMGRQFVDLDELLAERQQLSIADIIRQHGWEWFRARESETLVAALMDFPQGAIIACGGGIVESDLNRQHIVQWMNNGGLSVHLQRPFHCIQSYLAADPTRPAFSEDLNTVWQRRRPLYEQCSNVDFYSVVDGLTEAENSSALFALVTRSPIVSNVPSTQCITTPQSPTNSSFFLSLTCKDIRELLGGTLLQTVCEGVDAVELRVDLLRSQEPSFVGEQVTLLRACLPVPLPLIFTVRSRGQGGAFPDDQEEQMFQLLSLGVRLGCEFVDMEVCWSAKRMAALVAAKGKSRIIASYHHLSRTEQHPWQSPVLASFINVADRYGDVVKIVVNAQCFTDNVDLLQLSSTNATFLRHSANKPVIAINMGSAGQMSRALNSTLTPVTHPALPGGKAAPGQLSVREIFQLRQTLGLLPIQQFYLFGSPIAASMSPLLHNMAFEALGMAPNYSYSLYQADKVAQDLRDLVRSPSFGGASVTIPLKEVILELADETSAKAKAIGAANTLVANWNGIAGKIYADNTDWLGILNTATRAWSQLKASPASANVLVLGAGGTARAACYAAQRLPNVRNVYVWNRTASKADAVAAAFPGVQTVRHVEADGGWLATASGAVNCEINVVIATVPSSAHKQLPVALTRSMFGAHDGVLVELAYTPRVTQLVAAARERGWSAVEGIDVLLDQGFHQQRMWTGRRLFEAPIRAAVLARYDEQQQKEY